jgi:hypothetical protein
MALLRLNRSAFSTAQSYITLSVNYQEIIDDFTRLVDKTSLFSIDYMPMLMSLVPWIEEP